MKLSSQIILFVIYVLIELFRMGIITSQIFMKCWLHNSYLTFMNLFLIVIFQIFMMYQIDSVPSPEGYWKMDYLIN